ncbi:hypothetical protein E2C01_036746 [Portunus trituberculatus]|uniref:Uncharacterized protein n=1 Tax=Portunus trituberculatus TaxID=210409 RepID=A0A5B7FCX1_PORTR|nr:hypothetical protein [Portunus trituberculatus]
MAARSYPGTTNQPTNQVVSQSSAALQELQKTEGALPSSSGHTPIPTIPRFLFTPSLLLPPTSFTPRSAFTPHPCPRAMRLPLFLLYPHKVKGNIIFFTSLLLKNRNITCDSKG